MSKREEKALQFLVDKGAAVWIVELGGRPKPIAKAEIIPREKGMRKLFSASVFAEGQQHVYSVDFDETEVISKSNGEPLAILFLGKGKALVAYITTFEEWPELSTDLENERLASWKDYLRDDNQRRAFEEFYKTERDLHA